MGSLLERLERLGVLEGGAAATTSPDLERGRPELALLRVCNAGLLRGGLSVALGIRPDELFGPLCARIGGRARKLKVVDVRDRPAPELAVLVDGRTERWEVEDAAALVHNLNDLLRDDPACRAVAVLGEWEDMLQLWCLEKRQLERLLGERFFEPRNRRQLEDILS